jgi:dUTP pyrophosphatase
MMTLIQVLKLHETARLPEASTEGASCDDVFASNVKSDKLQTLPGFTAEDDWATTVLPGELARIGLDLAFEIPEDRTGKLEARSGMSNRNWAVEGGRLDPDYRGEVVVLLRNHSADAQTIRRGDKIAQLLIQERHKTVYRSVQALSRSARGDGGFGSTGT